MEEGGGRKRASGGGGGPLKTYIDKRQAIVAEWVDLSPIFGLCAKEKGYKRGWGAPGSVVEAGGI